MTLARIFWVPISALFLFQLTVLFSRSIYQVLYYFNSDVFDLWVTYRAVQDVALSLAVGLALIHLTLEVLALFDRQLAHSRLLTHLRLGPLVVTFLFAAIVLLFDNAMIEVSKYKIRSYVFESGNSIMPPDIVLHNNDRGWCGNGVSATREYLYFDSATEGLSDDNPYVRARSLRMMANVNDFLNGPDPRYYKYLQVSCVDADELVSSTAQDILSGSSLSCDTIPPRHR
jgi:hypothetical protein